MHDGRDAAAHVGDLAELHALGVLEPHERADVEAHAATCARCSRALGAAAATVAALEDAFVPDAAVASDRLGARIAASARTAPSFGPGRPARRNVALGPGLYATAAALVLAAGIGGGVLIDRAGQERQTARDSAVLATIATSHFDHVTLLARTAGAPVSKVLYARDGAWLYLVVDSSACDCSVVVRSANGTHDLGRPQVRGNTATLFVRGVSRPASLELVATSGHIIASARFVYAPR